MPVLVLVVVMLLDYATGMTKRCAESDAWGADIHNCVHTNAFNGKVSPAPGCFATVSPARGMMHAGRCSQSWPR